eukprot:CAMPEP_0195159490 /NCGR_PEP_ID=MMETSP0448-20130528/186192_1 /TAXON_ID=66468 /ORGANISM="Heterocapsa triquestra, Strain CCMP 448" /LENGTH=64 /DNA_ID=CAMNT_0040198289 /DNA_START=136 /DNA_END=330 /DNA_ORIENTATION=-
MKMIGIGNSRAVAAVCLETVLLCGDQPGLDETPVCRDAQRFQLGCPSIQAPGHLLFADRVLKCS